MLLMGLLLFVLDLGSSIGRCISIFSIAVSLNTTELEPPNGSLVLIKLKFWRAR